MRSFSRVSLREIINKGNEAGDAEGQDRRDRENDCVGVIVGEFDREEVTGREKDESGGAQPCFLDENGQEPGRDDRQGDEKVAGPWRQLVQERAVQERVDAC